MILVHSYLRTATFLSPYRPDRSRPITSTESKQKGRLLVIVLINETLSLSIIRELQPTLCNEIKCSYIGRSLVPREPLTQKRAVDGLLHKVKAIATHLDITTAIVTAHIIHLQNRLEL
jgi:hypothetical protein